MQVNLKLAQVLKEHNDSGRGLVKRLAAHTGLERHKVSALLKNRVQYVSLDALAKVCDYLVERHQLRPADLPSLLLGIEPEQFSAHVAKQKHLEIVLGVRMLKEAGQGASGKEDTAGKTRFTQRWVMASDSTLHGALLHELFGRGQDCWQARPESLEQRLVPAYAGPQSLDAVRQESETVYERFLNLSVQRACVSIGSVRSNGLSEMMMARTFDSSPFTPEDDVGSPAKRRCPVFFRFRDGDLQPPSCHGGSRLARRHRSTRPGIYYETSGGKWDCCPVSGEEDAALVVYAHHRLDGRLDVVMAGFTGRATRCLGTNLRRLTAQFWPPAYDRAHLCLGLFIVKFRFDPSEAKKSDPDAIWRAEPIRVDVAAVDKEVLQRRLD